MENTSVNTIEKSPEMSHSKDAQGELGQLLELKQPSSLETSLIDRFQTKDNSLFIANIDRKSER